MRKVNKRKPATPKPRKVWVLVGNDLDKDYLLYDVFDTPQKAYGYVKRKFRLADGWKPHEYGKGKWINEGRNEYVRILSMKVK